MPTPKTRPRPLQWLYEYRRSPEQDDSDYERSLKALHVLMEGTCDLATIRSDVGKGTLTIEVPLNTAVSAKTVACVAQPLWEGGTVIYFPPSIRPAESRVKPPDPSKGTLIVLNSRHACRVRNVAHTPSDTLPPIVSTTAANGFREFGGQLIGGTRLDFPEIPGVTVWSNVAFVKGHCSKGDYANWRSDPPPSTTPTSESSSQNKRRSDSSTVDAPTAKQSRQTCRDPSPGSSSHRNYKSTNSAFTAASHESPLSQIPTGPASTGHESHTSQSGCQALLLSGSGRIEEPDALLAAMVDPAEGSVPRIGQGSEHPVPPSSHWSEKPFQFTAINRG
jgi:hypothetical protein